MRSQPETGNKEDVFPARDWEQGTDAFPARDWEQGTTPETGNKEQGTRSRGSGIIKPLSLWATVYTHLVRSP